MKTRTVAVLIGLGVAVVGGGIAFAYFTGVGAGSGSAGTGTTSPIVVKQTSTVAAMVPGLTPQVLSGNFDNPNTGPVIVKSVTATVSAVAMATGAGTPACTVTDFAIGTPGTTAGTTQTATASQGTPGVEVPPGNGQAAWTGLNLTILNRATNQDACKGSTVTITYVANAV
jgi:hypothetical protein